MLMLFASRCTSSHFLHRCLPATVYRQPHIWRKSICLSLQPPQPLAGEALLPKSVALPTSALATLVPITLSPLQLAPSIQQQLASEQSPPAKARAPRRSTMPADKKRKAAEEDEAAQPSGKKATTSPAGQLVNPKRVRPLKKGNPGAGPVIYWMSRDQRVDDNWALLYALEQATKSSVPVAVAFNLVPAFLGAGARHWGFMLRGLRELAAKCEAQGIAFFMLKGDPTETIPQLVKDTEAGLLITDFSPLRIGKQWRTKVAEKLPDGVPMHEVDAHNVVPCWVASEKRETAARTIRPKIHKHLPEFLKEYPATPAPATKWSEVKGLLQPTTFDWDALLTEVLTRSQVQHFVGYTMPDGIVQCLSEPVGMILY